MEAISEKPESNVSEMADRNHYLKQSVKGTCFASMYDDAAFRKVSLGPTVGPHV